MSDVRQWLGAYQAVVVRNDDPLGQKRVTLKIPQVLGTATSQWAAPVSATGSSPPAVGSATTVMFLGGDINHPVYLSVVSSGGGGGGGVTRMPWNVLGGWSGSTFDPFADNGQSPFEVGTINAVAIVTDGTVPFSKIGMFVQVAQTGTGTIMVVTDASGNHLASGTNVDTVMTQSAADLYYVTLDTTITPPAPQTVYYVAFLWPNGQPSTANLVTAVGGANWELTQSAVSHVSWANTLSVHTSIPNPLDLSTLTGIANFPPFFGLK